MKKIKLEALTISYVDYQWRVSDRELFYYDSVNHEFYQVYGKDSTNFDDIFTKNKPRLEKMKAFKIAVEKALVDRTLKGILQPPQDVFENGFRLVNEAR